MKGYKTKADPQLKYLRRIHLERKKVTGRTIYKQNKGRPNKEKTSDRATTRPNLLFHRTQAVLIAAAGTYPDSRRY